jgi:hypothetical protein
VTATDRQFCGQEATPKNTGNRNTPLLKAIHMNSNLIKSFCAATLGLAFFATAAHAQLMVNVNQQATFGPFVGGTNNTVSNNGTFNTSEVVFTGLPLASPFSITYNPTVGPSTVTLGTGTLTTSSFTFHSPISPTNFFSSAGVTINTDFDNDGIIDLTQIYTINLSPFTAPGGFTGVSYAIVPVNLFGNVTISGVNYSYASVVANSAGTLFDGSSTTSVVQFQFQASPVPEPSTYALCGVMVLAAGVFVRRRFAQGLAA